MSRFLILTLPLLVILIVLGGGNNSKSSGRIMSQGESLRGGGLGMPGEREENKAALPSRESSRKLIDAGLVSPFDQVVRGRKLLPIPAEEAGTPELVEKVWEAISPSLREELSEEDEAGLRSYIAKLTGPEASDAHWICWGSEVPLAKVRAYHEVEQLTGLVPSGISLFANQFFGSKWNRTASDGFLNGAQGLPLTLTWSIVPDGTSAPGIDFLSDVPSDFRSWLQLVYGGSTTLPAQDQPWFPIFQEAFDDLENACGIRFIYEPNDDGAALSSFSRGIRGTRGDIRLAARRIDGTSGTLAFASAPDRGDVVFDSSDASFQNTDFSSLRLLNTATHEIGHAVGLAHVCPLNQTKLMEPSLTLSFRGARFDEYQTLQRLYGDSFENLSSARNNDSFSQASPLEISPGIVLTLPRLSIDGTSDSDYFQFPAFEGQKVNITLTPGEGSYLEGGFRNQSCGQEDLFDSATQRELSVEVINGRGFEMLETSIAGTPKLSQVELPEDGNYYLRVTGSGPDAAQLYRMAVTLSGRPPAARLVAMAPVIMAESGSVKNGRLDPGETLQVRIPLINEGDRPTSGLTAVVTAPDHVTLFSSEIATPEIPPMSTSHLDLIFGSTGKCGDSFELDVILNDDSGKVGSVTLPFTLGLSESVVLLEEKFDLSAVLPAGWTSMKTGAGVLWRAASSRSVSPLRSAYVGNGRDVGESILLSPPFVVGPSGGGVSFLHAYDLEGGFDGGVLEVSREGGAFFDLLQSEAIVLSGAYDGLIKSGYSSPIAGRPAWTGQDLDFATVAVNFPEAWAGETIQLRWNLAHDTSTAREGWYVDNVRITSLTRDCVLHRPTLSLSSSGGTLDENVPGQVVEVAVSSELPLIEPLPFTLVRSGSADDLDFVGSLSGTLPAGQLSLAIPFEATKDSLSEGSETLTLSLPTGDPLFAAAPVSSQSLTIIDALSFSNWLGLFFPAPVPPAGDSDGDGLSEIAEYLLGTDPSDPSSRRILTLEKLNDTYLIPLKDLPQRPDATLALEISNDLLTWVPEVFSRTSAGLEFTRSTGEGYFRLTFSLNE